MNPFITAHGAATHISSLGLLEGVSIIVPSLTVSLVDKHHHDTRPDNDLT